MMRTALFISPLCVFVLTTLVYASPASIPEAVSSQDQSSQASAFAGVAPPDLDPKRLAYLEDKYQVKSFQEKQGFSMELIQITSEIQSAQQAGNHEKLGGLYKQMIDQFPEFGRGYVLYISYLLEKNDLAQAKQIADLGLTKIPHNPELLMFRDAYPKMSTVKYDADREGHVKQLLQDFAGAVHLRQQMLTEQMQMMQKK